MPMKELSARTLTRERASPLYSTEHCMQSDGAQRPLVPRSHYAPRLKRSVAMICIATDCAKSTYKTTFRALRRRLMCFLELPKANTSCKASVKRLSLSYGSADDTKSSIGKRLDQFRARVVGVVDDEAA